MFLDVAIQLGSSPGVLSAPQAREMENLAFDWIINGEKYVDSRFPELAQIRVRVRRACGGGGGGACGRGRERDSRWAWCVCRSRRPTRALHMQVMSKAAELLGVLSANNLKSITARFLKEVGSRLQADSSSLQRQELLTLCHGLRFVRLSANSGDQVWVGGAGRRARAGPRARGALGPRQGRGIIRHPPLPVSHNLHNHPNRAAGGIDRLSGGSTPAQACGVRQKVQSPASSVRHAVRHPAAHRRRRGRQVSGRGPCPACA